MHCCVGVWDAVLTPPVEKKSQLTLSAQWLLEEPLDGELEAPIHHHPGHGLRAARMRRWQRPNERQRRCGGGFYPPVRSAQKAWSSHPAHAQMNLLIG